MNSDSGDPRRGADRVAFCAEVGLRQLGGPRFRVRVFDASPTGCKIEFIERPTLGQRVWVKFDGIEAIEAAVRWVDGHYGGVEFERPLYRGVFDNLSR